jgi:phosphopantothenoylcysteine decarboxylase/phosphopantothenate--cysteine ligase
MHERRGLRGARIVLGVCGGIAAYKAAELASTLVQAGARVDVAMTTGAHEFIQPLTFEGITHQRVRTSVYEGWDDGATGHVALAEGADLVLIAPATANTIARLAHGLVDDMVSAVALATTAPIVIAPAMEHHMWMHPATAANVETLRSRGVTFVGPDKGRLASGAMGLGRLAPTADIVTVARSALGRAGILAGKRVVVTAGGTLEAIDPVRYIGNRSSGLMGIALVEAATDEGADVRLIATRNVSAALLPGDAIVVESALELQRAVEDQVAAADVLIMAAAVADFRPAVAAAQKVKKEAGQDSWTLELVKNPDILAGIDHPGLVKVGFAAETERILEYARRKLDAKALDLIVANDAVATIGSRRSTATLIPREGEPVTLPELDKAEVARRIIDAVARILIEHGDA